MRGDEEKREGGDAGEGGSKDEVAVVDPWIETVRMPGHEDV